jgi:signal transduction histidine kinase
MKPAVPQKERALPTGRMRLALLVGFGGLLTLTVGAGWEALHVAGELHSREEQVRQGFLTRSRYLTVLVASIHDYSNRIQQYLLSQDQETEGPSIEDFSRLAAEIASTLSRYPGDRQPEEQALLEALEQLFAEQQRILNPILLWSREQRRREALRLLNEEVLPGRLRILDTSEKIALWNRQQLSEADRELFTRFADLQEKQARLLITALAAGLLLSIGSILYVMHLERQGQLRYLELAKSRSELEDLSARLVDVQETERRRISRELHDEVGQSLGALLVNVTSLSAQVHSAGELDKSQVEASVEEIRSVAEGTVQTVRDIALLLRPSMLDDLGLVAALEWQGREISRRSEVEVEVCSEGVSEDLSDDYKICIYRLVQEALSNVARHSTGKNARVVVQQHPDKILVSIADDGRGFDPQRVRGLGLLGMEERVKRLGGTLRFESKAGEGTTVRADLPLSRKDS